MYSGFSYFSSHGDRSPRFQSVARSVPRLISSSTVRLRIFHGTSASRVRSPAAYTPVSLMFASSIIHPLITSISLQGHKKASTELHSTALHLYFLPLRPSLDVHIRVYSGFASSVQLYDQSVHCICHISVPCTLGGLVCFTTCLFRRFHDHYCIVTTIIRLWGCNTTHTWAAAFLYRHT
jgi:hypothetical protein